MGRRVGFRTEDLDRIDRRIRAAGVASPDYEVWRELLSIGKALAQNQEVAEAAGLFAGTAPAAAIGDIDDAFRRSSGLGTRAIVGNLPPRR
jgi:hypothetical protein